MFISAQLQVKRVAAAIGLIRQPGDGDIRVASWLPYIRVGDEVSCGHRRC